MRSELENVKPMVYDDLAVGEELPVIEMVVDDEVQGRYLVALQDDNPWYYKDSPWEGPITHIATLTDSPINAMNLRYEYPYGWVHAKQDTEFINPLPLGKPFRIISKIADKYVRRGKGYVVVESLIIDQDGLEIVRFRNYGMIDDERIRESAKTGLKHRPPAASQRFQKKP